MLHHDTGLQDKMESKTSIYFEKLCAYLDANHKYPDEGDDPSLHRWIAKQRDRYRAGQLPQGMTDRLNSIGFIWNTKEAEWYGKALRVKQLLKEDQETFFSGQSAHLFRWLDENMASLRKNALHAGKIPVMKEIKALLASTNLLATVSGASGALKRECTWMANFNDLVEFRKKNQLWPRIDTGTKVERRLARWCFEMRYLYKRNALGKDWIEKLATLSFNFKRNTKNN